MLVLFIFKPPRFDSRVDLLPTCRMNRYRRQCVPLQLIRYHDEKFLVSASPRPHALSSCPRTAQRSIARFARPSQDRIPANLAGTSYTRSIQSLPPPSFLLIRTPLINRAAFCVGCIFLFNEFHAMSKFVLNLHHTMLHFLISHF